MLSGEEPPRTWGRPVPLVDVVRAAIAETEDLDRVVFAVDERLAVSGNAVADLTHLMAELVENAVHFSPPEASVIIRTRPYLQAPGAHVLTVEDWGVGMRAEDMAAANEVLAAPQEVDLSVSQRLGLHVVARLAQRHGIQASLTPTPGNGVTAAVVLPASLFSDPDATPDELSAGEAEVPSRVVPAALAAAVTPAADLPPPPGPPSWAPAERWVDLTEEPAGNGNGDRRRRPPATATGGRPVTAPTGCPATATGGRPATAPTGRPATGPTGRAGGSRPRATWRAPSRCCPRSPPGRRCPSASRPRPRARGNPTHRVLGPPNGRVADSREGPPLSTAPSPAHSPPTTRGRRAPAPSLRPAPVAARRRRPGGAAAVAARAPGPPGPRAAAARAGGGNGRARRRPARRRRGQGRPLPLPGEPPGGEGGGRGRRSRRRPARRGRSRAPAGRRRMVVTAAGTVDGRQLDWLLVDFVRSTAGARHALVVSADGLRLAASQGVDEALGDQLAAVTSGLLSLAQGIARSYGAGPVRQTIVEMTGGYLFLTSISEGSMLAVFAERACDMGMIGYEMTLLAARVGHMLTPGRRSAHPGPPDRMPR